MTKEGFISYYPLKQGLKLSSDLFSTYLIPAFISYYPLKQGLKLPRHADAEVSPLYLYPTIH